MVDAAAVVDKLDAVGPMEAIKESGTFDELMDQIDRGEVQLAGKEGLIKQITRAGLQAELTDHLRYDKQAPEGRGTDNSRNGSYPKTVTTLGGDIKAAIPRDRDGTFVSTLVPKGSRRTGGLDEMIISLYAAG